MRLITAIALLLSAPNLATRTIFGARSPTVCDCQLVNVAGGCKIGPLMPHHAHHHG
jgi:hypothetical protein